MYGNPNQIKIAAIAAELIHALPQTISMYEILYCAKLLVEDFNSIHTAYTEEVRFKLLN
jgi:hypothetical protein